MPRPPALDRSLLTAALEGLELQKARIEAHIASIRSQLGRRGPGRPPAATSEPAPKRGRRKKRKLSPEGRAAIAAAARKRWAKVKAAKAVRSAKKASASPPAKKLARKKAAVPAMPVTS